MQCVNVSPVFQAPIIPMGTGVVWDNYQYIVDTNIYVATESIVPESHDLDVITVNNVNSKCAHYSYVTIARQPVKIKEDTVAEVNLMSKHIFKQIVQWQER